jgi:ATP-dependent Clp protease ATP-binding subunit ClpA
MARLIQQKVREPLAEDILFGKLQYGGRAIVKVRDHDIALEIVEPVKA